MIFLTDVLGSLSLFHTLVFLSLSLHITHSRFSASDVCTPTCTFQNVRALRIFNSISFSRSVYLSLRSCVSLSRICLLFSSCLLMFLCIFASIYLSLILSIPFKMYVSLYLCVYLCLCLSVFVPFPSVFNCSYFHGIL